KLLDWAADGGAGPVFATGAAPATLWTARAGGRATRVASLPPNLDVRAITWLSGNAGVAVAAGRFGEAADRMLYLRPGVRVAPRTEMLPDGAHDPVPSPEGRFIAYLQDGGESVPGGAEAGSRITVVRANGTGRRVLTPPRRYSGLAWSPAGTLLAYAWQEGGRAAIEIADVLTGERLRIGDYRLEAPTRSAPLAIVWAPDGTRLAFGTDTGTRDGFVWVATLERR
ncbi:MAG TPA: hypothetical protein VJT33_12885, partial [bacterium]|nr:hypothetical protein [bacterium]